MSVGPKVNSSDTKAAWTVREARKITIGGKQYELHLGRNLKALLVYPNPGETVGEGGFGKVREIAMEIKTNLGVLEKKDSRSPEEHGLETAENQAILLESFRKEVQLPRELHKKAGGYQTGIQRAPYAAVDLQSLDENSDLNSLGILVHRYETTLEPEKMAALKPEKVKEYGLDGKKGPLKMLQGLFTGVRAVHAANMAHRDIKPQNAGIQIAPNGKPESCLADFGLAASQSSENPSGTPWYITWGELKAQSEAVSDQDLRKLQQKQDIYALAITTLEVLNSLSGGTELNNVLDKHGVDGHQPLNPLRENSKIEKLLVLVEGLYGKEVKDLLYAMLDPDANKRPSADSAEKIWSKAASSLHGTRRAATKKTTSKPSTTIPLGLFDSCPEAKKVIARFIKNNKKNPFLRENLALIAGYNQHSNRYQQEDAMRALGKLGITKQMCELNGKLKEELISIFATTGNSSRETARETLYSCLENPWGFTW